MPTVDLRHFLGLLKKNGELLSVDDEVDLRFELCEFLHQADHARGPALFFERIKGHSMKVAGNLVGTKKRLAIAFGLRSEDKLLETYRKRRGTLGKPRRVKDGPVKEVILRNSKRIDLNALPIPIYHEEDAGPYITCGILTAKDPQTGARSMGLHRLQVKDSRRPGRSPRQSADLALCPGGRRKQSAPRRRNQFGRPPDSPARFHRQLAHRG